MKQLICDTCGTVAQPDAYGLAPSGSRWLTISWRKDYKAGDYCSDGCATKALAPPPVSDVERTIEDAERLPKMAAVGEITAVNDLDVARMHDEGNPNDRDELVF